MLANFQAVVFLLFVTTLLFVPHKVAGHKMVESVRDFSQQSVPMSNTDVGFVIRVAACAVCS